MVFVMDFFGGGDPLLAVVATCLPRGVARVTGVGLVTGAAEVTLVAGVTGVALVTGVAGVVGGPRGVSQSPLSSSSAVGCDLRPVLLPLGGWVETWLSPKTTGNNVSMMSSSLII